MNYLDIKNLDTFSNLGSTDSVLLNKEDNSNFAGSITGDSLRKSLGVYGGIFNVTTCIPLSAGQLYTAETARAAVPIEPQVRQPGLTIKYKATAGWIQETFIGSDINTWTDPANWITLESISTDISELDGRLTTAETKITQNANAIATKASVTSVDLLTNRMSLAESNIIQTASQISATVSQTDFDELGDRVTSAESSITQNANAIATKVSQTTYDTTMTGLDTRLATAESNITQTANDIATKVSTSTYTTDINGVTTRLDTAETAITQNADSINSKASITSVNSLGDRVTSAESNITQNATNINLKVSKGDIISQINQSAEAITISASKIDLNGTVTFNALDTNTQNKINTAQSTANSATTAANTANTNLSTLSSSLGALAYEDQVTLAKLDSTIIQGGYIKTTLIDASSIVSETFVAKDTSNNMLASMNIEGRGEYVQYYTSGKKRMTFDSGYIRYYNDDANNTLAWELGSSGAIVTSTLDTWDELYMVPMYTGVNILTPNALQGTKFLVFRPGSGSSYASYSGLTVIGTVPTNTLPTAITPSQSIPGTDYTAMDYAMPGAAMIWAIQDRDNIYRRVMHTYVGGYRTNTFYVYFNADGNATDAEGNLI